MTKYKCTEEELLENMTPYLAHADEVVIDPATVFAQVETDRESGKLSENVTTANPRYYANKTHPGMMEEVWDDGRRRTGHFQDGIFISTNDS